MIRETSVIREVGVICEVEMGTQDEDRNRNW